MALMPICLGFKASPNFAPSNQKSQLTPVEKNQTIDASIRRKDPA